MMSAKEAREKTNKIDEDLNREQIEKIESAINLAVNNGKQGCTLNFLINSIVKIFLERQLGYTVQLGTPKNETITYISW